MKNIINLILAVIVIISLAIATVFTVEGLGSLNSTPYTGLMSVCSGLMLFAGTMYAMTFLNPFVELKKSWNILVSSSTLWGDRAGVPPIAIGNVNMKETEMKQETDAWKKQAERMTEELVAKYEERGLVIEEMKHKMEELRGSEQFYFNHSRNQGRAINRLKEELLNARRDIVNLKNMIKELDAEIEGEKRGAVDMIMSLTAQIKTLVEENSRLNAEIKMSRIIKAEAPVVKNDNPYYNEDWKLVRDAERTISMFQPKTAEHKQDKEDLTAKVSLARLYADGKMGKQGIPYELRESIKSLMALVHTIMG